AAEALLGVERGEAARVLRALAGGGLGLDLRLDDVGGEEDGVVGDAAERARGHELALAERLLAAVAAEQRARELVDAEPGGAADGLAGHRRRVALEERADAVRAHLLEREAPGTDGDAALHLHAALDELD